MLADVIGVYIIDGVSKLSGNAFRMIKILTLDTQDNVQSKTFNKMGHGLTVNEYDTNDAVFAALKSVTSFPVRMNLELEPVRRGKDVLMGVKSVSAAARS